MQRNSSRQQADQVPYFFSLAGSLNHSIATAIYEPIFKSGPLKEIWRRLADSAPDLIFKNFILIFFYKINIKSVITRFVSNKWVHINLCVFVIFVI